MTHDQLKIDYPNSADIKDQINTILDQSLPIKKSFFSFLKEMHHQLGWRYIFRDYLELGVISLLFLLYVGVFIATINSSPSDGLGRTYIYIYAYLFITSPFLFGSFSIISLLDKRETFHIEMVCKYNVYQVASYRMLVFGFVSIIANIAQILVTSFFHQYFNPVLGMMVSLTSLLIFAIGFLYITRRGASKVKQTFVVTVWVLSNLGMIIWVEAFYKQVLIRIPFAVYAFVILVGLLLYFKNIKQLTAVTTSHYQKERFYVSSM